MQNLIENWLVAWKMARNLVDFHVSSQKFENLHFEGLLLSKAYKVLDEKVQKDYVSWHWREMQNLTKNWWSQNSWSQKWHEEFGELQCEQRQV